MRLGNAGKMAMYAMKPGRSTTTTGIAAGCTLHVNNSSGPHKGGQRIMINWDLLAETCRTVCGQYRESAPVVARWADDLYMRAQEEPEHVSLFEVVTLGKLWNHSEGFMQANYAANTVYKCMNLLGQDTTGLAGF